MHSDITWFDTSACWFGDFIGNINSVVIKSRTWQRDSDPNKTYDTVEPAEDASSVYDGVDETGAAFGKYWGGWYAGARYSTSSPEVNWKGDPAYNKLIDAKDSQGPYQPIFRVKEDGTYEQTREYRANAWDVDLRVYGTIGYLDKDITTALYSAIIELGEDCDIDCQRRGSQITTVAILMSAAYALAGLNSLIMFCGTWIYQMRVISVYFTFLACFVQFILFMVVASMLFSKYSDLCRLSTTNTFKYYRWTIHDDFVFTERIWIASLFFMFIFVIIGMI